MRLLNSHPRRLIGDQRGAAAVEFAFVVPIMLLLYYGMVESTQALLVNRRASALTTAVGDLVTQATQVSAADVDNIFDASTAVMKPFPTSDLAIRVTSITMNGSGVPSSAWTRARGTIPATSLSTIDPSMKVANSAILRAETIYTFRTPFQKMLPGTFTFKHKMDLRPRGGVAITLLSS